MLYYICTTNDTLIPNNPITKHMYIHVPLGYGLEGILIHTHVLRLRSLLAHVRVYI